MSLADSWKTWGELIEDDTRGAKEMQPDWIDGRG